MADIKNYRIGVDYKLYTVGDNGERILEEETTRMCRSAIFPVLR